MDNTELITKMEDAANELREMLDDFRRGQNEDSDEGNEDHIMTATAALDTFDGAITDLVP